MSVLELKLHRPPELDVFIEFSLLSFHLGCNLVCILQPIRTIKKVMSGYPSDLQQI